MKLKMFKNKLKNDSTEEVNKSEYKNKILNNISISENYKYKNELDFEHQNDLNDNCNIDDKKDQILLISKRPFNESFDDENKEMFQKLDKNMVKINEF